MIGILCHEYEKNAVEEFFQLFKTPWEYFNEAQRYEVVLSTRQESMDLVAPLVIVASSKPTQFDNLNYLSIQKTNPAGWVQAGENRLPIYIDLAVFQGEGKPVILHLPGNETAALEIHKPSGKTIRVGFDIFQEVAQLLSKGQPAENAHIPTLEMHILILRTWILEAGLPLVEIPAIPHGYNLVACLTHDVDFVGIRQHRFDHTFWGFIYRALVVSMLDYLKGKRSIKEVWINWKAVLMLPLVYTGWKEDYWNEFEHYSRLEGNRRSTFFLIPFKNYPGVNKEGKLHARRAARYDIDDVKDQVQKMVADGFEISLHGLDAWADVVSASQELDRIRNVTGQPQVGVRMHWLYFSPDTFSILDQAGFDYDSTSGYNDAIGYRYGTCQVYQPFGARHLLELPLHIQDTALFYPHRMSLSKDTAWALCQKMIEQTTKLGGVLTILWHMRSLAPERLWSDFYEDLLQTLQAKGAWFGTASQVVSWFRQKRMLSFEVGHWSGTNIALKIHNQNAICEPSPFLRIYYPIKEDQAAAAPDIRYRDLPLTGETSFEIDLLEMERNE